MSKTAEILAVGTELLLGDVTNTDATEIARGLSELGINVYYHTVVGDNPARIKAAIELAKSRADVLVTTGGLGPTYDDITKETVAACFGKKLVRDEASAERLVSHFSGRGIQMTENNFAQAMLPEGCTVLINDWGTAPGCAFEADGKHVIMLPGPPNECEPMMRERAMPYLAALSDAVLISRNIHVVGLGESAMEAMLRETIEKMENPTVAPYAKTGECLLRVTAKAPTRDEAYAMTEPVVADMCARLGDFVYGVDVPSLEAAVLDILREKGITLATAESCTGGLLGGRITSVAGSSDVYTGGVVSYANEVKTDLLGVPSALISEHGAVSEQVARAMAEAVCARCKSDIGVGITGVAGPGASDQKPVGLVYIAIAGNSGTVVSELNMWRLGGRERIRSFAVTRALEMIRRYALGLEINY